MKYITTAGMAKIENTLNSIARQEYRHRADGDKDWADTVRRERVGMMELANQLRVKCGCLYEREDLKKHCACGTSHKAMMTRLRGTVTLTGGNRRTPGALTGLSLSGKGCRDSQGKFVPVSQCNPVQYMGRRTSLAV